MALPVERPGTEPWPLLVCWVPVVPPSQPPFPARAACLSEMTARPLPTEVGVLASVPPCHIRPGITVCPASHELCPSPGRRAASVLDTLGATRGLSNLLAQHQQELLPRLGPSRTFQRSPWPLRWPRASQGGQQDPSTVRPGVPEAPAAGPSSLSPSAVPCAGPGRARAGRMPAELSGCRGHRGREQRLSGRGLRVPLSSGRPRRWLWSPRCGDTSQEGPV